ncbi:MAG: hypothetical protein EXX96DRAFT_584472, partial [Benjaminiella poitrasii]
MLTNNYIESLRNQLKSTYLFRTRNRRLDLEYDLEQERKKIMENSGPMTSSMRERRRVEITAESLPIDGRLQMILDPSGNRGDSGVFDASHVSIWKVDSFDTDNTSYEINIHTDGTIIKCNCYYFAKNRKPCKHMH